MKTIKNILDLLTVFAVIGIIGVLGGYEHSMFNFTGLIIRLASCFGIAYVTAYISYYID